MSEWPADHRGERLDDSAADGTTVPCPMPGCGEEVFITWTAVRTLYRSDSATVLASPAVADALTWSVGCAAGHVLLLPIDHGRDGDDTLGGECYDCAPDEGESNRPVYHDDIGRLRNLLTALGGA